MLAAESSAGQPPASAVGVVQSLGYPFQTGIKTGTKSFKKHNRKPVNQSLACPF